MVPAEIRGVDLGRLGLPSLAVGDGGVGRRSHAGVDCDLDFVLLREREKVGFGVGVVESVVPAARIAGAAFVVGTAVLVVLDELAEGRNAERVGNDDEL
jgi:hypothetical protein